MKILMVTPYYHPKIGGLENYARQLSIGLVEQEKCEVIVATSHSGRWGQKTDTVDGIQIHRLPTLIKFSNTPLNPFWIFMLRRLIHQEHPDIIIAHTPVPSMADAVALVTGKTPLLLVNHAASLEKDSSRLFSLVTKLYGFYQRITFSKATQILAVSDYVRSTLPKALQKKTVVVPNAIWAKDIILPVTKLGRRLLFIGSLDKSHAWKGLDQILVAVSMLVSETSHDWHLTIMGDGDARPQYQKQVDDLGITSHVSFLGAQTGQAKLEAFQAANILITYPTSPNDAFPTVILEAWSQGLLVIGSAIGPLPSIIDEGHTGFLVEPSNIPALAKVIASVASLPVDDVSRLAKTAAAQVTEKYTWEKQAALVARIGRSLL